jgi:hypothetical protein
LDLAWTENFCGGDHVLMGPSQFPKIQVRPDHAFGMEDFHSSDLGLVGRGGLVDRVAMEHLGLK